MAAPTGLAIHPSERFLYIKSGNSGTVWKVPIRLPAPPPPSLKVVSDKFEPDRDIKFDATGNLYGVTTRKLWRIDSFGEVCSGRLNVAEGTTGVAVEVPGLSSNRLFFGENNGRLGYPTLSSFRCDKRVPSQGTSKKTCGPFRFLLYRSSPADLVGSWGNSVSSVDINTGECTPLVSGLAQPNGLAEDNNGNLYIADSGKGEIIRRTPQGQTKVFAQGLITPTGLVFDSTTGSLFVAETNAGRVTVLHTVEQQTPYSEDQTLEVPSAPR